MTGDVPSVLSNFCISGLVGSPLSGMTGGGVVGRGVWGGRLGGGGLGGGPEGSGLVGAEPVGGGPSRLPDDGLYGLTDCSPSGLVYCSSFEAMTSCSTMTASGWAFISDGCIVWFVSVVSINTVDEWPLVSTATIPVSSGVTGTRVILGVSWVCSALPVDWASSEAGLVDWSLCRLEGGCLFGLAGGSPSGAIGCASCKMRIGGCSTMTTVGWVCLSGYGCDFCFVCVGIRLRVGNIAAVSLVFSNWRSAATRLVGCSSS